MVEIAEWIELAGAAHARGELAEAEALYTRVLAREPKRIEALCGLAVLLSQSGRHQEALHAYPRAVVLASGSTLLLVGLAGSLLAQEEPNEALAYLRKALEIDPTCPEAHNTLGAALLAQGKILEAVLALKTALQHRPGYPEALYNLGRTLFVAEMPADAIALYAAAIRQRPGYAQAYLNQGFAQRALGQLDEAATSFRMAMTIRPGYAEAMHNLGVTIAEQGRAAEGVAWLKRAVQTDPDNALAHSGLVYLRMFDPASSADDLLAEARLWGQRHGTGLTPSIGFDNVPDPHRQIKLGFVSPDFRAHAESRFMLPLLAHLDTTLFEVHCYSSVRKPDAFTERMQTLARVWHDVKDVGDARLAERIREDGIDLLIDLTMHMEHHRLGVFARRPAPVQISWLAYPGATGLPTMDYHLTDALLSPPTTDAAPGTGTERPLRLPDAWFCYQAEEEGGGLPLVGALPALTTGHVTFGSLNSFRKISPEVLALWARLMAAVAGSRLILVSPEGAHRQGILDYLYTQGIAAPRVELLAPMPYADYMATCRRIDIGLDPFPHAGATTTLDMLNMGVPVLSLKWPTPAGRLGETVLTTAGLEPWVATTPDDFVVRGTQFAADLPRLANLRAGLREKVRRSPLMDAPRFARNFGQALRTAWHEWCDRPLA